MTNPENNLQANRLEGCALRVASIDPGGASARDQLAAALSADAGASARFLRVATVGAGAASLESALLSLGAPVARALTLGLELCAHEARTEPARWTRPLALAFAARAVAGQIGVGDSCEAFTAALLSTGTRAEELAAWRVPPRLAVAASRHQSGVLAGDADQDDSVWISRILGHATILADALQAESNPTGVDWGRLSRGLEALREILHLDRSAFAALLQSVGHSWADFLEELGAPRPAVPTLECVQVRAGDVLADDALARALEPGSSAPLRGLRILAVDDEPVSLRLLERVLRLAGHEVVTATNGSDALRVALETHPHAVIADWLMPELDGIDLCRALRRSELGRSVFFLLLTGRGEEDRVVEAFDAGVDDYVTKPFNPKILLARLKGGRRVIELQERVEANRRVVMKQVAEMGLLTRKLRNAAHTDALTDLPNRRYAMARLESEWEATGPGSRRPLAVILIDIDHFKRVNDSHGHDVGDLVLKEVATVLRANTRHGEEAARLGGEEFFVVCSNANEDQARIAGERLRAAVERHVIKGLGFEGGVTISVGVAQRRPEMANQDALIKSADHAVYAAKAAGRNRVIAGSDLGTVARSA
ncbi:MAG: diguanylate cyclase [Planctomycetes bacterium]|nr:diguanylate cyclase [Planctomycetota bacterium]